MAPVLKYPGAKWSIADWIISYFPPHINYLEVFIGGAAVFLNKLPSPNETINDIDDNVVNLLMVIRDHPEELARLMRLTPWSRTEYNRSFEKTGNLLEDARRYLVRCWQAFGVCTNRKTGWRCDVQGRNEKGYSVTKQWHPVPKRIIEIADRLTMAQIECQHFAKLIPRHAFKTVFIYADPPYLLGTRRQTQYAHEMKDQDHEHLLELLEAHPGPVILSGYRNEMYDSRLKHWQRVTHSARAERGRLREEVLWINPVATETNRSLFDGVTVYGK